MKEERKQIKQRLKSKWNVMVPIDIINMAIKKGYVAGESNMSLPYHKQAR
jgi:hypothetical protein